MSNRGVRIRGVLLIVLGIALAGFMAWLLGEMTPAMQPGGSPSGTRFTGTEDQGRMINTLFMALIALGIVFALYGLYMAATGKENRVVKIAAWVLWGLLIGGSLAFSNPSRLITDLF